LSILVTGGTGFIGLNLIEALLSAGETVVCLSSDAIPDDFRARSTAPQQSLVGIVGDVRDGGVLVDAMRRHDVTGMYPLAAVTANVQREASDPETIWAINTQAMVTQLRAARDCGVARIVVPSSVAVYGDAYFNSDVVDEVHTACTPSDIYGISKLAAERLALRLAGLWKLNLSIARIGGTFGPWERITGVRDTISPFFYTAQMALAGGKAILPSDSPSLSWCYSRDIASGLIHMFENAPASYVANISSGVAWGDSIAHFADELQRKFPEFSWELSPDAARQNIRFSDHRSKARMNISRMHAIGWRPAFPPKAAIADYVEWLGGRN